MRLLQLWLVLLLTASANGQFSVTTYHYDNARTGQNTHESILQPSNVNANGFGKLFAQRVDGQLYAEPLFLANVFISGQGMHNVLYVATEHDSVYAFDADNNQGTNNQPLWHVNFLHPAKGITTIPSSDVGTTMISPEIGITSTPVIDQSNGTIYVVAATKENGSYFQRLHALDITTGAEKFGGPIVIQATVPGTGWGSVKGTISFDPLRNNQRPALLLSNGVIYISWASHGLENQYIYHGWVIGYNETTLQQTAAFSITPNGKQGGIWQSGCGLSADNQGNLFFISGNGTFDANSSGADYGMSFVKLSTPNALVVKDYFTPYNEATLSASDLDLGSGGPLLIPYQSGAAHPYLITSAGKNGVIYVVDRTNMGHFNTQNNSQIVQSILNAFNGHGLYGSPAYWQNQVYFWGAYDVLRIYPLTNGLLSTTPVTSTVTFTAGATPVISSNGPNSGIVWALQTDQAGSSGAAVLYALDANTAVELYDSTQAGARDAAGPAIKFTVPTVVNGKVYVGTANQVDVYGLF